MIGFSFDCSSGDYSLKTRVLIAESSPAPSTRHGSAAFLSVDDSSRADFSDRLHQPVGSGPGPG